MSPADDPRIATGMRAQLACRRKQLAAGDAPLGWKVGFGAPAVMQKLGITAPIVGYLMRSGLVAPDAEVSFAGWSKPVVEPEIALHMGADLDAGADRATAQAAIAAIGPAFELADVDLPPEDVQAILTRNIYQRHVMLGPRDAARAGARLDGLVGHIATWSTSRATSPMWWRRSASACARARSSSAARSCRRCSPSRMIDRSRSSCGRSAA